jgi:hypothetical protein
MLYKCPNCEKLRLDDGGKCPSCGADYRGSLRGGKHAVEPRELRAGLKQFLCEHGILRDRPCPKCCRSEEECKENYETAVLMHLKEVLIKAGLVSSAQAWDAAKFLRAQIDASDSPESER